MVVSELLTAEAEAAAFAGIGTLISLPCPSELRSYSVGRAQCESSERSQRVLSSSFSHLSHSISPQRTRLTIVKRNNHDARQRTCRLCLIKHVMDRLCNGSGVDFNYMRISKYLIFIYVENIYRFPCVGSNSHLGGKSILCTDGATLLRISIILFCSYENRSKKH